MSKKNNNPFKQNDDTFEKEVEQDNNQEVEEAKPQETVELNKKDELQEKFDVLNNQYLRLAADFDNFRKRQAQEREDLLKYGSENALKKMIEVLDNFERGEKALQDVEDCQKVKDSFNMIYKQTFDALAKLGLEVIDTNGAMFDPNFHEAIMQTATNELPENSIVAELQKGYRLGEKVLRASLVNVATEA
ncbi:MAG: nucleotide exchange factor GrpE [Candidatus Gastranaerophilales bacterium]